MKLSDEEKAILDGAQGEIKRKALDLLVTLANIYDADSLIPVQSAHINGASVMAIGESGVRFVEEMASEGDRIIIPATTNPGSMPPGGQDVGLSEGQRSAQSRLSGALGRLGAQVCSSCTPYLVGNLPKTGQHVAWAESSAISYVNSVVGARTNREGGPTAIASAIIGKTPRTGLHLDVNRAGTMLVRVIKTLEGTVDYGTLGYFVGKHVKEGIPVFEGVPQDVSPDQLKMLSAALATSGSVALFHIVGVTPEAATRKQAFQGRKPVDVLDYGTLEEAQTLQELTKTGSDHVEWVTLGCPHFSLTEFGHLAQLIAGKKVNAQVVMWVNTSIPVARLAKEAGYLQIIEEAGAEIICETCPVHIAGRIFAKRQNITNLTTNSAKMAHYAFGQLGLFPRYGSIEQCVRAAISGRWL